MTKFADQRARMVDRQIRRRGITKSEILQAMVDVPRELFVPEHLREYAFADGPLPIGSGQTISQPFVVALMIDAADVRAGARVLEIGAGSGYAAAVISRIAARVYAVERHEELADAARERLQGLRYENVEVRAGDGSGGWPEAAPFDAIIASAGGPAVPQALKAQLDIGGVLVMPVGLPGGQRLVKVRRVGANHYDEIDLGGVSFVPMIGAEAWPETKPA